MQTTNSSRQTGWVVKRDGETVARYFPNEAGLKKAKLHLRGIERLFPASVMVVRAEYRD
jgi:hypothetical protein